MNFDVNKIKKMEKYNYFFNENIKSYFCMNGKNSTKNIY